MKNLIIYDFDGPFIDSPRLSHAFICDICDSEAQRRPTFAEFAAGFHHPFIDFFRKLGIRMPKEDIDRLYFSRRIHEIAPFYDDVFLTCELLARVRGATLCVVSSNIESLVRRRMDSHNLTQFFSHIKGDSTNKAAHIRQLNELYGTDRLALYVGDVADDMMQAHSAGVIAVGLTRGQPTKEILYAAKAHIVLDHLSELPDFLAKVNPTEPLHEAVRTAPILYKSSAQFSG